jgi:hypothetical protein
VFAGGGTYLATRPAVLLSMAGNSTV